MKRSMIMKLMTCSMALVMAFGSVAGCAAKKKDPSDIEVRVKEKSNDEVKETEPVIVIETDSTTATETEPSVTTVSDENVINIYASTQEVVDMCDYYLSTHPDIGYTFDYTLTESYVYDDVLSSALSSNTFDNYPDIYMVDISHSMKYIDGSLSQYAASYSDLFGHDIHKELEEAEIAPYTYELATRDSDGEIVGLTYQSTAGVMIYSSSIALEVFGTDDPEEISELVGGGSGSWDKYWECAEQVSDKGYAMVSSPFDIYKPMYSNAEGWCVDGKPAVSEERLGYLDIAKMIKDNDYSNLTTQWTEAWYADMDGQGERKVFSFFGPAWLINYTLSVNANNSKGDWKVTDSPEDFIWGATWLMASQRGLQGSEEKKQVIADLINWATLDTSEEGYQYLRAIGAFGVQDAVPSSVVLRNVSACPEVLGYQDMFPYIADANDNAYGMIVTSYTDECESILIYDAMQYAEGKMTRDDVIEDLESNIPYFNE